MILRALCKAKCIRQTKHFLSHYIYKLTFKVNSFSITNGKFLFTHKLLPIHQKKSPCVQVRNDTVITILPPTE